MSKPTLDEFLSSCHAKKWEGALILAPLFCMHEKGRGGASWHLISLSINLILTKFLIWMENGWGLFLSDWAFRGCHVWHIKRRKRRGQLISFSHQRKILPQAFSSTAPSSLLLIPMLNPSKREREEEKKCSFYSSWHPRRIPLNLYKGFEQRPLLRVLTEKFQIQAKKWDLQGTSTLEALKVRSITCFI